MSHLCNRLSLFISTNYNERVVNSLIKLRRNIIAHNVHGIWIATRIWINTNNYS